MEELYAIMRDLLEVEYNQESLLYVLRTLEAAFDKETQGEVKLVANSAKYYLEALQEELNAAISKLDTYMAAGANKR